MKLSVPVYSLKRLAKALSRDQKIPLHAALNRVAQEEGFTSWSLLAARLCAESPARELFSRLAPGDLVLLGARPSHGKTLLGLELALASVQSGRSGWFFTLEWNAGDLLNGLRTLGLEPSAIGERFGFDNSDAICASYIIDRLASAASGTVVVIDYLQLLDQKRENPELAVQVRALKAFARVRGLIVVFISQIDRSYDPVAQALPSLADVRLPNPLDLSLFNWTCFLNNGAIQVSAVT
ncbi:DNA helicase [Rhodoferax sp. AJA081-3]|uniref:DNA helicase n=1 Tax=Rhodoferax sp. AJA081-3 TaxID=2752316 RepID=UPI001ADEDF02|nr:DNA helicase [Rhodoferax sp. AJA081-3]QTN26311.1 DNA helicase [Rhodoferax sp. AJA081-3]